MALSLSGRKNTAGAGFGGKFVESMLTMLNLKYQTHIHIEI